MKTIKMGFSAMAFMLLISFTFSYGQSPAAPSVISQNAGALFNFEIQKLTLSKNSAGKVILTTQIGLRVQERENKRMNMSFILVFSRNGKPFYRAPFDVHTNGAITCAVTCAGACPSIFGDGVCTGCGCDYNNFTSIPVDNAQRGEVISVKLIPAKGALRDRNEQDNQRSITL